MCSMSDFTDWPKTEATLEEYLIIIPPPSVQHRNTPECVFVLSSLLGVWNSSAFNHLIYKHSFKYMWFHHSTVSDTLHRHPAGLHQAGARVSGEPIRSGQHDQRDASRVSQSHVEVNHVSISRRRRRRRSLFDLVTSHLNITRLH